MTLVKATASYYFEPYKVAMQKNKYQLKLVLTLQMTV